VGDEGGDQVLGLLGDILHLQVLELAPLLLLGPANRKNVVDGVYYLPYFFRVFVFFVYFVFKVLF